MNDEQFKMVIARLDCIISGLSPLDEKSEQKDKIITMNRLGLKPVEIAKILGTSSNSVSVTISKAKKK